MPRLERSALPGISGVVLLAVAIGGCGGGGARTPASLNVQAQAQKSFDALYHMLGSRADEKCYESLDRAIKDLACALHWEHDAQSAATESAIWEKALYQHRVPVKYLDVAHAFKDTLLYESHVASDLKIAVAYEEASAYYHTLPEANALQQKISDLQSKLRAAGLNPYVSEDGTGTGA